jgi:hypothetical protein
MMTARITSQEPYLLLGWAASRLGLKRIWPSESVPLASVDDDGTIHAVVIYNAFYDNACFMHIASAKTRRWATRSTLRGFFHYPFVELGLARVQTQIAVDNIPTQIMVLKLGFRFEGVKRGADGQVDMNMFGLMRSDCKFIDHDNETEETDAHDAALQHQRRKEHGDGQGQQRT